MDYYILGVTVCLSGRPQQAYIVTFPKTYTGPHTIASSWTGRLGLVFTDQTCMHAHVHFEFSHRVSWAISKRLYTSIVASEFTAILVHSMTIFSHVQG